MDAGQLAEPIAIYAAHLTRLGYAALTIKGCTDSARHLGAWLALSGIAVSALDEHVLERFSRHRCRCGGNRASDRLSAKYVNRARRFARFLGRLGLVTVTPPKRRWSILPSPGSANGCVVIAASRSGRSRATSG